MAVLSDCGQGRGRQRDGFLFTTPGDGSDISADAQPVKLQTNKSGCGNVSGAVFFAQGVGKLHIFSSNNDWTGMFVHCFFGEDMIIPKRGACGQ